MFWQVTYEEMAVIPLFTLVDMLSSKVVFIKYTFEYTKLAKFLVDLFFLKIEFFTVIILWTLFIPRIQDESSA